MLDKINGIKSLYSYHVLGGGLVTSGIYASTTIHNR